jgi:hypothetical protein
MVHESLWQKLIGLDRQKTSQRAKCQYFSAPERYVVTLLNTEYVVNLADKEIFSVQQDSPPTPAKFAEQLCLLVYLINAQDLPLVNKLVKAEAFPGGQFFFRSCHNLPTEKLEEAFVQCPEKLCQVTREFRAEQCQFGDASIELYVLPRVPLTMIVWGQCEEFPARASILLDQTAAAHLPLDTLLAAVNLAVEAVVRSVGESR